MCGIAGFIDFTHSSRKGTLEAMTNVLEHRGPDGENTLLLDNGASSIGLGHRRLSVIDLSDQAGQPMRFGRYSIVFNGEIYNYREIKEKLSRLGHRFETLSDTEVILHAYAEWKEKCLNGFVGMFAFAIYDQENRKVFFARDRAGVKPLFYYWDGNVFLFASELKSFHQHPRFEKKIDTDAAAAFLQYGNVPTPYCIFKNTKKIKAGHFLELDIEKKKFEEKSYWQVEDFYSRSKLDISFDEARRETENILTKAFRYRMVSDVPVGVFLSGGYDSATLTAILQKDNPTPLKTFTIGMPDIGLNEAPFAKEIARYLGTDHTEYMCTEYEAVRIVPELPHYYDEPFADSSAIPTMLVSRIAREEVVVALSADGGDEIFAGYSRYDHLLERLALLGKFPFPLLQTMGRLMSLISPDAIPHLRNTPGFAHRYERLADVLREPSEEKIIPSLSEVYSNRAWEGVMRHKPKKLMDTAYDTKLQDEFSTPLSWAQCLDYKTYLMDDILQKVDRASMRSSLESREPFLDQHIIEYVAQLPDHFKYHKGNKKYILKEIAHRYIPAEMMERPKMGFGIPLEKWLAMDLKPFVDEFITERKIREQNIFSPEAVMEIKRRFYAGRKEFGTKLWHFLMFQMWHEKWIQ